MRLKIKKNTAIDIVASICILFLILSAVYPKITIIGNNAILCFASEIVWLILAYCQSKTVFSRIVSKNWYFFAFMAYVSIIPYLFGNPSIGNRYIYTFGLTFGILIFEYYYEIEKLNMLKKLLIISAPFFLYTFITTFIVARSNPWFIRAVDNQEGRDLLRQGFGGYHFVYLVTIFFSVFVFIALREKKLRLVSMIVVVVTFSFVVISNYFTAVLVCLICVFVAFANRFREHPVYFFIFLIPIIIIVVFLLSPAFQKLFLGLFSPEGRIYRSLNTSNNSLFGAFFNEFVRDRWPVNQISIDAFLKHPIFGIVVRPLANDGIYDTGYGQHSFILDTFALFGFVIGVINVAILYGVKKEFTNNAKELLYSPSVLVPLFTISLFNNITHSVAIAATIIAPLIVHEAINRRMTDEAN